MDNALVARALHGLSVLHELESLYPRRPDVLRFVVESRAAIYSAARVSEEIEGSEPFAGEHVPLDERLRAFYEDPLGVRSWAITAGSFFGPGVFVAARARRFLFDARVAAVYGLLDGAMVMLVGSLSLSEKRRVEIHERLQKLADAAAKVLRPDSAFEKPEPDAATNEETTTNEETSTTNEETSANEETEVDTVVESTSAAVSGSEAAAVSGSESVVGSEEKQAMPEALPAPAPEHVALEEEVEPSPEPEDTVTEPTSKSMPTADVVVLPVEDPGENVVAIASGSGKRVWRKG